MNGLGKASTPIIAPFRATSCCRTVLDALTKSVYHHFGPNTTRRLESTMGVVFRF